MINTVDLVALLHLQNARFFGLLLLLEDRSTLKLSTSLSYKNLVFKAERENSLYIQTAYLFDEESSAFVSSYYEDPKVETLLKPLLELELPQSGEYFAAPLNYEPLSEDVNQYLKIAESIAKQAYLCASGDDYSPGYFGTVVLTSDGILLEQINHMNSRSLAHKADYSLRDLTFFITYNAQKTLQTS